jgi:two-component system NarL family sensor kinase
VGNSQERVLVAPISVRSFVLRFAIAGFIALVVVAMLTAIASRRIGTDQAIDEAKRVAAVTAGIVEPLLTSDDLDRDELEKVNAAVNDVVLQGSLVRVKIWRGDGTIIYSDEDRLINQQFELGPEELEVLADGGVGAEVSDLSQPENRFETGSKLLEVYSRAETTTGTSLLYETYFRYKGVSDVGRELWSLFAPITLGALIVLELVQIPLAWSMARRLHASQQEQERLLRHALDASDAERRRIASDLHDGVVQELAGVSLALAAQGRLETIDPQQVVQASASVRASIKSLRSLLVEIYPANLEEEGLQSAVGDLLNVLAARGISTRLVADLEANRIDLEASALAYRVAQEALRNVVSHAAATEVRVTLDVEDSSLILTVDDNGKGFSTEKLDERTADGHVGLRSLAGLAADLRGSLQVRSSPGTGTRVQVTIPIDDRMHQ